MTSPLDEFLEIDIPVDIAMYELHSRVIENVDLGGALHYLNGKSFRQSKLRRILFEPQILNGLNERVGVRVLRTCSGTGSNIGRDRKRRLFFQARDGRAKPNLHGAQPLGAFKDLGRVFSPDVPVLSACILEKYSRGRTRGGVGTDGTDGIHYCTYGTEHRAARRNALHGNIIT